MTAGIVKSLLVGAVMVAVGILVAVFVSPIGWAVVFVGVCVYFYVPFALIMLGTRREPPRPYEQVPDRYGATLFGTVMRYIDPSSSRRR
jgi:hypothetical protein